MRLRYLGRANFTIRGQSGQVYRFMGYGSTARVKPQDAGDLLAIQIRARACCGRPAQDPTPMFTVA